MKFNKTLIALALASTLSACGSDSKPEVDTVAPVITLSGDSNVTIGFNETYTDAGASASDVVDGSVSVTTNGEVDTSIAGEYTLTFTATDAAGNSSTTTRTITVLAPVETTVTGQAVKGVLANAIVTVYKFVDGEPVALDPATELKDGEITTDGSGNYSFIVLDYEGPIKVELSPSTDPENPTTMICDAPMGCGDTTFGDAIDLTAADPEFKLAAISIVDSESAGEVKVNVSALTHLASELIEADDGGVTADTVTEQSTLIASTFGIEGDITQLEATVTTEAAAVAGEDNEEELRLGLINAGIMAAMFSGETDDTAVLSTKLAEVAADLIENDGALLVNQDEEMEGFELAISDVLEGAGDAAAAAVELIVADETLTGTEEIIDDLAQEEVNLENEQAYQEANVGDDGLGEVVIDEPTEGDAVAKAKAMVNDVRLFTHLFDETTTEGADIRQGTKYTDLMEAANEMISIEADSFTLLAQISNALAKITLDLDSGVLDNAAGGVAIADYLTPDEITGVTGDATGTITFNENTSTGGVLFTVNASAKGGAETATLNASAEFSTDGKSIVLSLDGSVESAGATFTLADTSFAKINFDSVASRAAFDDDTFEGEIVSGELKLDVELAQKASDTVTNPITFTGMLHTKLLPIGERVLDERWDWDENSEEDILNYGRPEIDTFVLPEMLTLSGEFSSFEQDSISATLTVGINNLAGYEAPDFKYIGKEIESVVSYTISADKNSLSQVTSSSVVNPITRNVTFTGISLGNWDVTNNKVSTNTDEIASFDSKGFSRTFDSGLDIPGFIYTGSYVWSTGSFVAWSVKFTPVDENTDGTADYYTVQDIWTGDGLEYDSSNLINSDGQLLTSDGNPHTFDVNAIDYGIHGSIEDFIAQDYDQLLPVNPMTTTNAAEFYASYIKNWTASGFSIEVVDEGRAKVFFYEDELEALAAGDVSGLPTSAYIIQPLIKDAFTMEVSADAHSVTTTLGSTSWVTTFAFTGEGNSLGDFEALTIFTDEQKSVEVTLWSETENIGLDIPEVILSFNRKEIYHENDQWQENSQFKITPIDNDGDDITDQLSVTRAFGDHFTADGVLVYEDGVTEAEFNDNYGTYSYATDSEYANITELLSFNPLTVDSALEFSKNRLLRNDTETITGYADGIGSLEVKLSSEDIDSIVAGSTTMFDAYNTEADSRDSLEDENVFLDVNAALTLEAILGDYQVKIQLSADRTALEAGAFDLAMSYRLPGADTQRSFTVSYNTEVEGRLTANNADGVVLVLNEPDEDATGTQVIGQILVGPTAIVAATIEDRGNGLVVIVYSDETTETL